MFKNVIKFATLSILISSSAIADDFLSKISNGALSDTSIGVKTLSLNEMKDVKGGAYFYRDSSYDFTAGLRSYAYVATEDGSEKGSYLTAQKMGLDSGKMVLAKYRYVNNKKDYYLQSYEKRTGKFNTIFAWQGSYAHDVLQEFIKKH
ncbi:hypothetical protein B5C91_09250 [Campylobacter jejuni]|nr:hypothetical protein [Campylobacter jejuni]